MSYTIHEITLGALLHDIGKLIQRAFGSTSELNWKTYDMESTLCPKGKYQNYTHRHVLFTNAFFDLMEYEKVTLPPDCDPEKISRIASFHHKPESCPDPAESWICTLADRYSAGMDRKEKEDNPNYEKKRSSYRETPLRCIFNEIILSRNRPLPEKLRYRMGKLEPYDNEALIPVQWQDQHSDLPKQYMALWNSFWNDFKIITAIPNITARLFEEALLGLLENYTWAIPSSTMDLPDISLYDHNRTTAAIAACLFTYHQIEAKSLDVSIVKNDTIPKFRFLTGDLSGLQTTLFTLKSQGVKGVSKILRARSFMLGAIAESAALQTIDAFGLPCSCVVQQAGGRFLILVPAISGAEAILSRLRNRFDEWLFNKYSGTLALHLSLSPSFSGKKFKQGNLADIFAHVNLCAEEAKQTPLASCKQGVITQEYPYERICDVCGIRPAQAHAQDAYRCSTCQQEAELGKQLPQAALMVWEQNQGALKPIFRKNF